MVANASADHWVWWVGPVGSRRDLAAVLYRSRLTNSQALGGLINAILYTFAPPNHAEMATRRTAPRNSGSHKALRGRGVDEEAGRVRVGTGG